jgi:hypothetical protein
MLVYVELYMESICQGGNNFLNFDKQDMDVNEQETRG